MLHEVIITLSGVSGKLLQNLDFFVDLKPFLHPSEIILLDKIFVIARDYKYLKDFINANSVSGFDQNGNELQTAPGLYIQAFCQGLETVLKPYQNELLELEENILIGPQVTLIYVYSRVDSYSTLFSLLRSLVEQIITRKIHGCQILQILYENIMSGVDRAKESLECILKKCHIAFLRQTTNWLINGTLIDSFGEYIIKKSSKEIVSNESDNSVLTYNRDAISNQLRGGEYEIASEFVPLYISYSLVNDILFVGKIVQILNESSNQTYDLDSRRRNLIFGEKEQYFFEKFALLKETMSVDSKQLEEIVHDIRECVVKHLWKLAVENENLYGELQLLKNFYLLGLGQFFKEFLVNASVFSLHPSQIKFTQDLNVALNQTASSFPFMEEEILKKFRFVITSTKNPDGSKTTESIWSLVRLQYTAKWPLNLLFTPVAIQHYNKLFLFLLRIRRCQIELHNVWKIDIKNKNVRCGRAWKLRNELMFLIDNLQYYLQVDVIETEYNNFMNAIKKVEDFQQIEKMHNMFLLNILSHSFLLDITGESYNENDTAPAYSEHTNFALSEKPYAQTSPKKQCFFKKIIILKIRRFYNALVNNLKVCEKFCLLASKEDLDKRDKEIIKLDKSFQKYKNTVFCFLTEYQSRPFKQHVVKFLLRLNFNNWINKNLLPVSSE